MQTEENISWFVRPCHLENSGPLFVQPDKVGETFDWDYVFCHNVTDLQKEMPKIYGSDQRVFNDQSRAVCLALVEILLACTGNVNNLSAAFEPYRAHFLDAYPSHRDKFPDIDTGHILQTIMNDCAAEIFFSYIAFYRHLMAATAAIREDDWKNYGHNRYVIYNQEARVLHIFTPLDTPRYQDSVKRFHESGSMGLYRQKRKEWERQQYEMLREDGDEFYDYNDKEFEEDVTRKTAYIDKIDFFEIMRQWTRKRITFGKLSDRQVLENYIINLDDYVAVYRKIDLLFKELLGDNLLSCKDFLDKIFRIQFWFIHLMPDRRGSLAVMQLFRYCMTLYYNARARHLARPLLPITPTRRNYFPDLEALLCCRTEEEFINGSMTTYYCVDFTAYLE